MDTFLEMIFPFGVVLFGGAVRSYVKRELLLRDYYLGVELTLACAAALVAWWLEASKRFKIANLGVDAATKCATFAIGFGILGFIFFLTQVFIHQSIEESREPDGFLISPFYLDNLWLRWIPRSLLRRDVFWLFVASNLIGGVYLAAFLHMIKELP